jgi:hypothetical protein
MDFIQKSNSAYGSAWKNNWLDEICQHMLITRYPKNFWTKEKCQEEALKYNNKTEFSKFSGTAYSKSCKNNWLNEFFPCN